MLADGRRGDRPGRRDRGDGPGACAAGGEIRRRIAGWRPQHAELPAAGDGRRVRHAGAAEARAVGHDGRVPAGRGIHPQTGNPQVMLCERGIRTFEDHTRFTLPLATVPYLHDKTHLPVVVDPSHGTGKASLVATMARAAIAAGCGRIDRRDPPDPENALSDGFQALTPAAFKQLIDQCRRIAEAVDRTI